MSRTAMLNVPSVDNGSVPLSLAMTLMVNTEVAISASSSWITTICPSDKMSKGDGGSFDASMKETIAFEPISASMASTVSIMYPICLDSRTVRLNSVVGGKTGA